MENQRSLTSVSERRRDLLFWAVACLLIFWALGRKELIGSEDRWAEVTREMFLTGDFFHPTLNGVPYFDKPLLGYWLVGLISALTGSLNEWTVRLPSALSAVLALWATRSLGRKLWSGQVARTAGWILLTTYGFLFWARLGEADMENLAAIIAAVAWYWARRERPSFGNYLVFYLICLLGAQAKGLGALVVPLVALFPDVVRRGRWKRHLRSTNLLALFAGSIAYLAPFLYASLTREGYHSSGLGLVFRENFLRYFSPFDHVEPVYAYFYHVPVLFLPWTPILLAAMAGTILSAGRVNEKTRWLLEATGLIFLFFTASGSRRVYYILPILPFCALLVAVFFSETGEARWRRLGWGFQWTLLLGLLCILIVTPFLWPVVKNHTGFVPPGGLKILGPFLGPIALIPSVLGRWRPSFAGRFLGVAPKLASMVGLVTILMGGVFCWGLQRANIYDTTKGFSGEIGSLASGISRKDIGFFRKVPPKVLFYARLAVPVRLLADGHSLRKFVEEGGGKRILISRRRYLEEVFASVAPENLGRPLLSERVYPWEKKAEGVKLVAWMIEGTWPSETKTR